MPQFLCGFLRTLKEIMSVVQCLAHHEPLLLYNKCYFADCLHLSENRCLVKEKVHNGEISNLAYECYKKLSEEAIFKKERYSK